MVLLEGTNYGSYFPCTPEGTNYDFYSPPGSIVKVYEVEYKSKTLEVELMSGLADHIIPIKFFHD